VLVLVWMALAGGAIAVGSQMSGATGADRGITDWVVARRTLALDKLTAVTSGIASTLVVIGIASGVVLVAAVRRRWDGLQVLVVGMIGEVTLFLLITLLVDRSRPDVQHLDPAPPTSSFPSGHTFATFVLWNTIYFVARWQRWPDVLRAVLRVLAIAMPLIVGASRVYRGMHHPTDVLAALTLGVLWTGAVVVVMTRMWSTSALADDAPGVDRLGLRVERRVHSTDDEVIGDRSEPDADPGVVPRAHTVQPSGDERDRTDRDQRADAADRADDRQRRADDRQDGRDQQAAPPRPPRRLAHW
jgi:undecaprenyl-diphosphatase